MPEKKPPSRKYRKIDPDEFENYEERFVEKSAGGGKSAGDKGKKTLRALKKQQQIQSAERRHRDIEDALKSFLNDFSGTDDPDTLQIRIIRYCDWIEENLRNFGDLDLSDCVITFTKSGGPGGQNVNKRETKVMIIHQPTNIRVDSDQTRSQMQNKNLALELLRERLGEHLGLWKVYLDPGQSLDMDLVKLLMD